MQNRNIIAAINTMNSLIGNKDVKMAYELRRGIRRNHPKFMEEYNIMDEERNRLVEPIKDVDVDKLSEEEREEYINKRNAIEKEVMALLDKDVDIKVEKVSERFLRESELSLADEMALEFMLIPEDDMGGDE